ncbi:hypothetical protein [Gandjariella thermophila]|uniref:Uncharacterized protein n=1 Tax=Gandjariella thermophila TaxID=1931992 RepID=A0A4D4J4P9_9PSEU|nr:hypothetical protein [Gandjariella thermophila]GDY30080.1 hypothetical protein GTS_17130 [Gandjariella thermophila]
MLVTLYGARDNDPPGSSDISYPQIHSQAGGTGTYDDPITFATDKDELLDGEQHGVDVDERHGTAARVS